MATVELKSISELFGLQFFVPSYQRGYRWTTVQVRELLEDLYDFSDDNKREDDDYYCLQPVIVKGRGEQWELVDGQQRLTAIWLLSALYYCSNRDDEINLEHQKYELEYEGKPIFTELFSLISKYVQDDTMPALIKHLDAYKEKSIDSRNLIESIEYIAQFTRKNKRPKGVLAKIFEAINSIKIIWYVLDSDEDPIQTFTNINANKIELTNTYERFPFELYKDEIWDIEHINPQTPKEASDDEKRVWLNSYLGVLENGYENLQDPDLVNSIKKCLSSRLIDFENIAKRVQTVFELSDNDAITNLVLLDANTNRGYKNACFAEKRIKIIEVERSKNNDEKYIPIGTKWVFLKGFENAKQLIIWGAVDMQDYSNDMATSIYTLLGGEINGNE